MGNTRNKKTDKRNTKNKCSYDLGQFKELWLFLSLSICIFVFCSNLGICGKVGYAISGFLFGLFGWIQYIIPFYVFTIVVMKLYANERPSTNRIIIWLSVALVALAFNMHLFNYAETDSLKVIFNASVQHTEQKKWLIIRKP